MLESTDTFDTGKVLVPEKYWHLKSIDTWRMLIPKEYINTWKLLMLEKYWYFWYVKNNNTFNTIKVMILLILEKYPIYTFYTQKVPMFLILE